MVKYAKTFSKVCTATIFILLFGYFCFTMWNAVSPVSSSVKNYSVSNPSKSGNVNLVSKPSSATDNSQDPYASLMNEDGFYNTGASGYVLTPEERILVERAVMREAGGEGLRGEMMVAQCILDGALRNGYDVKKEINAYCVAVSSSKNISDEVHDAVARVFDKGQRITMEKADLWYNPALVESSWHENQQYIITVGSHRFFWMNSDM